MKDMTEKELIDKHNRTIKAAAIWVYNKFRSLSQFTVDELYNIGLFEMLKCIDTFNNNGKLDTYIYYKIKHRMIDEMRRDEKIRTKIRKSIAIINLEDRITDRRDYGKYYTVAEDIKPEDIIDDDIKGFDIEEEIERKDSIKYLFKIMKSVLSKRECVIIFYYYKEDLTLKEIGEVFGLTQSSISWIKAKAIKKIRNKYKLIKEGIQ